MATFYMSTVHAVASASAIGEGRASGDGEVVAVAGTTTQHVFVFFSSSLGGCPGPAVRHSCC